jgi:hypothetical protein
LKAINRIIYTTEKKINNISNDMKEYHIVEKRKSKLQAFQCESQRTDRTNKKK